MKNLIRGAAVSGLVAVVVLVAGLALKQESGGGSQASANSGGGGGAAKRGTKVVIKDFEYGPQTIEVKAGSKLRFTNEDTAPHTATSRTSGAFDTGRLTKGQSASVTLKKKGTFKYYCEYHQFMNGTVKVD